MKRIISILSCTSLLTLAACDKTFGWGHMFDPAPPSDSVTVEIHTLSTTPSVGEQIPIIIITAIPENKTVTEADSSVVTIDSSIARIRKLGWVPNDTLGLNRRAHTRTVTEIYAFIGIRQGTLVFKVNTAADPNIQASQSIDITAT